MATDASVDAVPILLIPGSDRPASDPVLKTAGDRSAEPSLPALADPIADHLDPALAGRRADVEEKHRRVIEYLDRNGLDAVVLTRADSIAWFTGGADLGQTFAGDYAAVMLFINRNSRAVLADNVHSARVFEEEVAGLGFQLKERPWHDDPQDFVAELSHNKKVVSDNGVRGLKNEAEAIRSLRLVLSPRERQILRELGRAVTLAVEATCRNFHPGETEADVAGHLAHRLIREGIAPQDIRVAGDDRLARYRQFSFKAAPILRRATIAVTGRRQGVCASVTRTVAFGPVDEATRQAHYLSSMVDATFIYFSRPGEVVSEIFRRAKRIYEKFGHPDEWMLDYQGFITGHHPRERMLKPHDNFRLAAEMAVRWSPSVGACSSEDTIVVDSRGGYEVVTEAQNWPKVGVQVKGYALPRPSILIR
ncbi:MAG: M24 family metallopeptidase [Isosphaeraceae bacterium]